MACEKKSMEKKHNFVWSCLACNYENTDTRRSFVVCVNCGNTYRRAGSAQRDDDEVMPSPEQSALESWWNEDPEMRRAEIMCGENYRVNVRLWQITMDPAVEAGEEMVGEFEAGTLLEAIQGAVVKAELR